MIGQRTRGLQSALLICQLVLVPVLLLLSGLVVFTSVTAVDGSLASHYPMYALAVMAGLLIEGMKRDKQRRSRAQFDCGAQHTQVERLTT